MSYDRARWQGVIGVHGEGGRVTAITATGCDLSSVPASIGSLDRLTRLDLSCNDDLHELPASLGRLRALRELYLYDGAVHELPAIDALTALEVLDLNRNPNLAGLPALDRSPLQFLYAESCGLTMLPALPVTLRYLNVSHNPLETLAVGELEAVEELRAEFIHLNETPVALHQLGKLRELHLRGNGFRDLPPLGHDSRCWAARQHLHRADRRRSPGTRTCRGSTCAATYRHGATRYRRAAAATQARRAMEPLREPRDDWSPDWSGGLRGYL